MSDMRQSFDWRNALGEKRCELLRRCFPGVPQAIGQFELRKNSSGKPLTEQEFRLQLCFALIQCHMDSGEASYIASDEGAPIRDDILKLSNERLDSGMLLSENDVRTIFDEHIPDAIVEEAC